MIGVDTNVLVRLLIEEDATQTALAVQFFDARSSRDPAFISLVVVAELAWVLGKTYKFSHDQVKTVMLGLLEAPDVVVERDEIVRSALAQFDHVKIDLADLLIAATGRQAGAPATVTFDRNAAKRISGMELLA